jgi:hypothetical protein
LDYKNRFHQALMKLSVDEIWVLQAVYELRGLTVLDFQDILREVDICEALASLEHLQSLKLVERGANGEWVCTWIGTGVNNWRWQLQLSAPEQIVTEPLPEENGDDLGPPCSTYRAVLFAPGYCWCCRPLRHHASEVVRAAERLLRDGQKR